MQEIDDSLIEGAKQLLNAVKSDDKESFDAIIVNARYTRLSFGRFPLLSLMYLYNSRKILKAHEKELLQVTEYIFVEEDDDAYLRFKQCAGRSLRLYANTDKVVAPEEMLAVLEHDEKLKRLYQNESIEKKNKSDSKKSVQYIYEVTHGRSVRFTQKGLKISRKRLSKRKFTTIILASVLTTVFILFCAGFTGWSFSFGDGSEKNPIKVSTSDGLLKMLGTSDACLMQNDLSLESVNLKNYNGILDGGGHTLYIKNTTFPIIGTLYGKIKNINIVFGDLELIAEESVSLLSSTNEGVIFNVNLNANCTVNVPEEEGDKTNETRHISFAAIENNGEINGIIVNGRITVNGTNTVNTYVSAVVGKNAGDIVNCSTTSDIGVVTDTADIGGIVAENLEGGTVKGCVNNASLRQTTAYGSWNPNIGGIALINDGSVLSCVNRGEVRASTSDQDTTVTESVNVGGIVCSNNKAINRCKNFGVVEGSGATVYAYVGGIVSYNAASAAVTECGEEGEVNAICGLSGNNFSFAGGIAGYNGGYVLNNYSSATLTCLGANKVNGGIVGVSDNNSFAQTYYGRTTFYSSNYFVGSTSLPYGIASYLYEFTDDQSGEIRTGIALGGNLGTTYCETADVLKTVPVYWE